MILKQAGIESFVDEYNKTNNPTVGMRITLELMPNPPGDEENHVVDLHSTSSRDLIALGEELKTIGNMFANLKKQYVFVVSAAEEK